MPKYQEAYDFDDDDLPRLGFDPNIGEERVRPGKQQGTRNQAPYGRNRGRFTPPKRSRVVVTEINGVLRSIHDQGARQLLSQIAIEAVAGTGGNDVRPLMNTRRHRRDRMGTPVLSTKRALLIFQTYSGLEGAGFTTDNHNATVAEHVQTANKQNPVLPVRFGEPFVSSAMSRGDHFIAATLEGEGVEVMRAEHASLTDALGAAANTSPISTEFEPLIVLAIADSKETADVFAGNLQAGLSESAIGGESGIELGKVFPLPEKVRLPRL